MRATRLQTRFDNHQFSGRNVCHRGREQIGALLLNQAGLLSSFFGFLVGFFRMFLFLNFALNKAVADMQPHAINRRAIGQRKNVNTLNPVRAGVPKLLANRYASNQATDVHVHVGIEQRCCAVAVFHSQQQTA